MLMALVQVVAMMRTKLEGLENFTRKERVILKRPVCQQGFRKILGLGATRYSKLAKAIALGRPVPVDGRSRPRKDDGSQPTSMRKRALVLEFLEELRQTVAEAMPEASGKRKASADGEALHPSTKFRRLRGKKPGKWKRIATSSKTDKGATIPEATEPVMKLLPPGSFTDYFRLLEAKHPEDRVCFQFFCKVI